LAKIHGPVVLLFIALAAVMTWPLVANLHRAVAWPGDPFINTWILDWDWYATIHQPFSLFDANAFYPASKSLAYSENLYGLALLLFPLRALGISALTAYNIAMLAGYAFSGFGAYLLGRHVTGSAWAGIAAGVFYAFLPFRFTHASHVQHVWGGWLPVLLLALLRYVESPAWKRGAAFGAVFVMNGLTNIHALLFGSIAIAASLVVLRPARRDAVRILVCSAVAGLLLLPFLLPYIDVANLYKMERNWHETKKFSAMPSDWLVSNEWNHAYRVLENGAVNPERWLFPGALCLLFAAFAIAARGRAFAAALLWIVIGFVGSLGTHTFFHRFLWAHVLGFRAIRVPARWAVIAYVGLAVLVALGTAVVARKRPWIGAAIAAAFVVEMWSAPFVWYMADAQPAPVYRWIAAEKPGAILELPMGGDAEYGYMLSATAHHRPMFNGVSGFAPPQFNQIASLVHRDPVPPKALEVLNRFGCDYIVAHGDYVDARTRRWLSQLKFVRRFDHGVSGDWVFRPEPGPPFMPERHMFSDTAFGYLDQPLPGARVQGRVTFSGWAMSPYGIREVNLLFNNGLVRRAARLEPNPYLHEIFPFYAATTRPAFSLVLDEKPDEIWPTTDVQTEIVDGHGRRVLLQDRFIRWK
jgi:hypothetical protein